MADGKDAEVLQVVISPAKQMRVDADAFAPRGIPPFPLKTERIVRELRSIRRERGDEGLRELWRVNDKLLDENVERLREFASVMDGDDLRAAAVSRAVGPAITSYVGIQYRSMAPEVLDAHALEWLQRHLWILSALYGCVRPFDAVQPYRLEMAAKLQVDGAKDLLYGFWGGDIASAICGSAASRRPGAPDGREPSAEDIVVVNLASVEYSKAVLPYLPERASHVTVVFGEDLRAGRPVQRATASKIARGSMVRWMAENAVARVDELERFDIGYAFDPGLSSRDANHGTLVFMRR